MDILAVHSPECSSSCLWCVLLRDPQVRVLETKAQKLEGACAEMEKGTRGDLDRALRVFTKRVN